MLHGSYPGHALHIQQRVTPPEVHLQSDGFHLCGPDSILQKRQDPSMLLFLLSILHLLTNVCHLDTKHEHLGNRQRVDTICYSLPHMNIIHEKNGTNVDSTIYDFIRYQSCNGLQPYTVCPRKNGYERINGHI